MAEATDQELLAGIARGEKEPFQGFYERYGRRVLGSVLKQLRDREVAHEVVQEVFLSVWTSAKSYRPGRGAPDQWLFAISRNKVRDHWRRVQKVAREIGVEATDRDEAAALESAERALDAPDVVALRLTVEKAMENLTPAQTEVVRKVYLEGLTFSMAGEALGIPTGTVKSRINAALKTMRTSLAAGA